MSMIAGAGSALRNLRRVQQIAGVLVKNGLADIAQRLNIGRIPFFGRGREAKKLPLSERFADTLQDLGPTFVKLGQMLSQRPDIVPPEYIKALRKLQDKVKPFPVDRAKQMAAEALGSPLEELYAEFSPEPLASGSIAQVHTARLKDGREVVVKIRRPGIEDEMKADLSIMRYLAALAEARIPEIRVYQPVELVEEFARSLLRELDFNAEGSAIAKFAEFFKDDKRVIVPQVIWSRTTREVITLSKLKGTPLSDTDAIAASGLDRKRFATLMAECFMRQFFELGTFHGDPHPGNLLLIDGGKLGLLDFGAVGHLSNEMITELAALVYAFSMRDIEMLINVYEEIGVVGDDVNRQAFSSDIHDFFDRYYGLPADRIHFAKAFTEIVEMARRHNARLPRELVIFGRVLVSGLSSVQAIDPEVKVSEILGSYVKRLMVKKFSAGELGRTSARMAYSLVSLVRHLPEDARSIVRKLRQGRMQFEFRHSGLEGFASELDRASNRLAFSVVIASIIIGSSWIMGAKVGPSWGALSVFGLGDVPILGLVGFLLAGVMGMLLAWSIFRSGALSGRT